MRIDLPAAALSAGFVNEPAGTHTTRTMMLLEMRQLLVAAPDQATYAEYQVAATEQNVLRKGTLATRKKTFRHLRELYALSASTVIFRALRELWRVESASQPLLALLCATARDPLLRATANYVLTITEDEEVGSHNFGRELETAFPGRLRADTLDRTGRNVASSWTQSGHLSGRLRKVRSRATCGASSAAYALFLGYVCGSRGEALFHTLWTRLCDQPEHALRSHVEAAARLGYLEYHHGGGITEIRFAHLLSDENAQ